MQDIEGPGRDLAPRGFELLAEAFVRIQRGERCIDAPLLQEVARLSNELAQSDSDSERLLALIRRAFSAYDPPLQYFAARTIISAIANRELASAVRIPGHVNVEDSFGSLARNRLR